ncbi:MAG TPA: outer membrane beta-barrel protein [Gemmatimonadaceae bacterium]
MPSFVRQAALALAVGAVALLAPAGAPQAQDVAPPRLVEVSPYAGYMVFGNMFDGPLGTSLANANGAVYGAQLAIRLTPGIAIVGNVARADASLQAGVPFLGGYDIGESRVMLYDAGLQLGTTLAGRTALPIAPFVQVGVGGMRHDVRSGPLRTDATNLALNAGLGADVGLSQGIGLRLMAKDYMGRFDTEEATGLAAEAKFSHNVALSAGLTFSF